MRLQTTLLNLITRRVSKFPLKAVLELTGITEKHVVAAGRMVGGGRMVDMKFASVTRISTSALISPSASLTSFYNRHNFALSKGVVGMMTTLVLSNWSLMTNMCSSPQSLWKQSCVALWLTRTKPKLNSHPSLHLEMGRNAYRDLISNKIWDRAWFKISF